jgi:hypothetical protein
MCANVCSFALDVLSHGPNQPMDAAQGCEGFAEQNNPSRLDLINLQPIYKIIVGGWI